MDDGGLWYRNDYGPDWETAYNTFTTYRKEFPVGQDGWLTASLSARDRDKDGVIEAPPSIRTALQGDTHVAVLDVPDHTGGAIFRPTEALPPRYRVEYKLTTFDFGGRRHGTLEYEGRINGYDAEGCKTQHPWGEGSNSPGWRGDASEPYCKWQDVRAGPYGYNGFHFLAIVDVADPAPRNNHFWHYRRKVLMTPSRSIPTGWDPAPAARCATPPPTRNTTTGTAASTPSTCGSAGSPTGPRDPAVCPATRSGS